MSAATVEDVSALTLPLWASDKEDGIRAAIVESPRTGNRCVFSRTFKPIQNIHIRWSIHHSTLPIGIDGELVAGNNFQDTASAIMSVGDKPPFKYRVFDYFGDGTQMPFDMRYEKLMAIVFNCHYEWLELLPQRICTTHDHINEALQSALARGKEGIMLRCPDSYYKCGKSTLKQQALLKLKPFIDDEAQVVGFTELVHENTRAASGTLGALTCVTRNNIKFSIGTGFSEADRKEIWDNREKYYHKWVTFKYQSCGVKIAPRSPVFLRWKLDHNV